MPRTPLGNLFRLPLLVWSIFAIQISVAPCADEQKPTDSQAQSTPDTPPTPVTTEDFDHHPSTEDLAHWSFRPLSNPTPPAPTTNSNWVLNPIDNFILDKLTKKGLTPAQPAPPQIWLRRIYLDVTGLPPTRKAVEDFEKDPSPQARQQIVDQLLNDPGYGVRWGRKWLDLVRYADTNGYERDGDKPHVWKYRDYVVDSLNKDKPFDLFLTEQLAGDEVDHPTAETMIASTYLRLGAWDDEPADPQMDRFDQLDDIVKSVSANFLALTLNCARCHHHKFEPISQLDYAGIQAFFEPLQRPHQKTTDLDLPVGTPEEITVFHQAQARYEAALKGVNEQLQPLLNSVRERHINSSNSKLPPPVFEAFKTKPGERTEEQKKLVEAHQAAWDSELAQARTALEQQQISAFETALENIKRAAPPGLPRGYIWKECDRENIPVTYVFRRGNPATPAVTAQPHVPRVLEQIPLTLLAPAPQQKTSLRRLSLARWLTNPEHPLTTRVIANRIWQGHFGEGIVRTENDFGVMGSSPTHPELLDWLARYLVENKWSLKQLHRVILLSNTYAQSGTYRPENGDKDLANELLSRFPARRLEAEQIRDSLLCANGRLNTTQGGPGFYPKIPDAVLAGQSVPGLGWGKSSPSDLARRSIYIHVKRSLLVPFFELMDLPDTVAPCEQRNVSTIPTQALTLLNSEFMHDEAEAFADRLHAEAGSDPQGQITLAYWLALSRPPSPEELELGLNYLTTQQNKLRMEAPAPSTPNSQLPAEIETRLQQQALQAFALVMINLNEFVYLD